MTEGKDGYDSLKDSEFIIDGENGVLLSTMIYNHFLKKKIINVWEKVNIDNTHNHTLTRVVQHWRNFSSKTVKSMKEQKKCKDFLAIINARSDGRIQEVEN